MIIPIVLICVYAAYRGKKTSQKALEQGIQFKAPDHAMPEQYRGRPDDDDIRTVRVPEKCSSFGAAMFQDNLEWTGPLEAKCGYCGAIVRARLEKL